MRRFKPGDRVRLRSGGPVMEVVKYAAEEKPLIGTVLSETDVVCVWYEGGRRCTDVIHQNRLTKVSGAALYRT